MNLSRIVPGWEWLRGYRRGDLRGDLFAGMVVAVMLVPQGMAYALLAGLPPVVGILQLLMGILRRGFLTHVISHAVMSGFTSAAAIVSLLSSAQASPRHTPDARSFE